MSFMLDSSMTNQEKEKKKKEKRKLEKEKSILFYPVGLELSLLQENIHTYLALGNFIQFN